ncbi:hypothetical protein BCR42DRAFT_446999 [Absidia repens]|uniref:SUZ domain-containing protein n=1 Tax=Absidia repens TaxID=90262 RepID=A0A1X2IW86_9FUNG|nr:hypothetical protein BCR42DRAFT_446999 [Absidia repens]
MSENDAWDDWETAADTGLADFKKPETPKTTSINKQNKEDANAKLWKQANEYSTPTIIRTDTIQTQYQPEIKILKRSNDAPRGHLKGTSTGTAQTKSLVDREKDYLLARKRIFGDQSTSGHSNNTR